MVLARFVVERFSVPAMMAVGGRSVIDRFIRFLRVSGRCQHHARFLLLNGRLRRPARSHGALVLMSRGGAAAAMDRVVALDAAARYCQAGQQRRNRPWTLPVACRNRSSQTAST